MKRHLRHLHPRSPVFWILVAVTAALVAWALWPQAVAAVITAVIVAG